MVEIRDINLLFAGFNLGMGFYVKSPVGFVTHCVVAMICFAFYIM